MSPSITDARGSALSEARDEEVLMESADSQEAWGKMMEVIHSDSSRLVSVSPLIGEAVALAMKELGRFPQRMTHAKRASVLAWIVGKTDLTLELHWSGAALWTLSRGEGIGYRDRDGVGTGKEFVAALRELRAELDACLS